MSHKIELKDLPEQIFEVLPFLKDLQKSEVFMREATFKIYAPGRYCVVEWNEHGAITYYPDATKMRR